MFVSYEEAKARVTLADAWDMAPNPNGTPCPHRGNVVVKSPLRPDSRGKSFSISQDLRAFKDHAETAHKGTVYNFIELCRPEWQPRDIVRCMIDLAGGDPDQKDPSYKPKTKTAYKAELAQAKDEARARLKRENYKVAPVPPEKMQLAPAAVARQWARQHDQSLLGVETHAALAAERGWPEEWVEHLIVLSKMVFNAKGEPCFAVECIGDGDTPRMCGVHARWRPESGGKAWAYRPCMKWDKCEVAALPFYLGSVTTPLWIVCEGQWDATTAYGMLSGFSDHMAVDAFVLGLRGASGADVFMAAYAKQLRKHKPRVLLIPDADKAGAAWTEDDGAAWCFMRRLRKIYGLEVSALKFKATENCKDLNDFYQKGGLRPDAFVEMLNTIL